MWGVNFSGNGSVVGTIIVEFAKYASYCGLIFVDRGIPQNLYTPKFSMCMVTLGYYRRISTVFVDSPTSSTTVIISDSCSLAFLLGVGGY